MGLGARPEESVEEESKKSPEVWAWLAKVGRSGRRGKPMWVLSLEEGGMRVGMGPAQIWAGPGMVPGRASHLLCARCPTHLPVI